jgi:hypothetical protein
MSKIKINCDGIGCNSEITYTLPKDWSCRIGDASYCGDNYVFCPKCKLQEQWFDAVCPGCVCGFPDCDLGHKFMYNKITITKDELNTIRSGKCPCRTNGTLIGNRMDGLRPLDISEQANNEAGNALANAIDNFIKEH